MLGEVHQRLQQVLAQLVLVADQRFLLVLRQIAMARKRLLDERLGLQGVLDLGDQLVVKLGALLLLLVFEKVDHE